MKIKIVGIAFYHPEKVVTNDYYIRHFEKRGKNVKHLLEDIYGREKRYLIANKKGGKCENSLTMQIEATKKVLKDCKISGKEIDGIIITSQINEYIAPPNAAFIHEAINGGDSCLCYDLNVNCGGMVEAFQQAAFYMEHYSNMRNILIVCGDYINPIINKENELLYGIFSDSACAVLVTSTKEESMILETQHYMHNQVNEFMVYPKCGMSNIFSSKKKDIQAVQYEKGQCDLNIIAYKIKEMVKKNNLTLEQITAFCFTQLSKKNMEKLCEELGVPFSKCPYIGEKYGYTLSSSPFLALDSWIQEGKVNRGDYILFWAIGSGIQHIMMLIKY